MRNISEHASSASIVDRGAQGHSLAKLTIAAAIVSLPLVGCGISKEASHNVELLVTGNTTANYHYVAPSGVIETPMFIEAGTIVGGHSENVGGNGTCTVRWTDMENRLALTSQGGPDQFLDLPCANLAFATDADRRMRVPYDRLVPAATAPDEPGTTAAAVLKASDQLLSAPVWTCISEKAYREDLGKPGAKCVVLFANSRVRFVDPKADRNSKFYQIKVDAHGTDDTYVVHKNDLLFMPGDASDEGRHGSCKTTPKATCIG